VADPLESLRAELADARAEFATMKQRAEEASRTAGKLAYETLPWHPGNGPRPPPGAPLPEEKVCRVCGYFFERDVSDCPGAVLRAMRDGSGVLSEMIPPTGRRPFTLFLPEGEFEPLREAAENARLSPQEYARHAVYKTVMLSFLGKRVHVDDADKVTIQESEHPIP
jgi:hypothetical protein